MRAALLFALLLFPFTCSKDNPAKWLQKMSDEYVIRTYFRLDFNKDGKEDMWVITHWSYSKHHYVNFWYGVPFGKLQAITIDNGKKILMWQPSFTEFEELDASKYHYWRLPYEVDEKPWYERKLKKEKSGEVETSGMEL